MLLCPPDIKRLSLFLCLIFLSGCGDWSYYNQSISGHLELMRKRESIQDVLAHPDTPAGLRQQLHQSQQIRQFATRELGLPDNKSYTSYVDLKRPYVVWNVVATQEFSLQPEQWCYPIAGCVPYRGFYRQSDARRFAGKLHRNGYDVTLYGVPAYSTLNWFDDPILNTFVGSTPTQLAALVFHELAHQVLYVPNDATFNEAFAVAVETEGTLRYIDLYSTPEERQLFLDRQQRGEEFIQLLLQGRQDLQALYKQDLPYRAKRVEKHLVLRKLQQDYRAFKTRWGFSGYDHWVQRGINNARLASISTYHTRVAGFRTLFRQVNRDFSTFYDAVKQLASLPKPRRHQVLERLAAHDPPHWALMLNPQPPQVAEGESQSTRN